jgi:hypothetical protein
MEPLVVDLPHSLGAAEARRRVESGAGTFTRYLPAGARVEQAWNGDRMELRIAAMGQQLTANLDVQDKLVRVSMVLPAALGFFTQAIEAGIRRSGTELLQDKRTA